jgi:hypothetical protein
MRKITFLVAGLLCSHGIFAQQTQAQTPVTGIRYSNGTYYSQCTSFEITRPLRELAAEQERQSNPIRYEEQDGRVPREPRKNLTGIPQGLDPAAQRSMGERALNPPGVNWTGQAPGGGEPLDPTGAAGLTAYVQSVNCNYQAFNKTTGAALMSSLNLSTLWAGTSNAGDPVVLYDKMADRWFIQQFQLPSNNKILIAISTTNDPTGTFYKYTFTPDASDQPDYLKFSIWPDGYYMTANYSSQHVVIYDRVKMLAGNPAAGFISKPLPAIPNGGGFWTPSICDADGTLPPTGTPAHLFSFEDDNWGGAKDQIHVYNITTNWTTPANTTVAEDASSPIATAAFNSTFTANAMDEISQKGSTQHLDAIQGIFMFRAQYRMWTGYNTVLLNNVVNANGSGQAGIRWYELRQDQTSKAWSIHQQGTYAPDATENRWMGSMAMDDYGSIGLCYAVSGPGEYPSLRYTGRYSSDVLGTMPFAEVTAKAGTGAQSGVNRWGDYSHTSLDPDGMTFWHTGMWENGSSESSQIYSFKISPSIATVVTESTIADPEYSAYQPEKGSLLVKASNLTNNDELVVDLFDVQGKLIVDKKINPAANSFETSFSTMGLAKGAYLVRIGNVNFQKILKVVLN